MKMTRFTLLDELGSFLADGDLGNRFRFCQVEPALRSGCVVFDLKGVTNMTDSFANACFGNLALDHAEKFGDSIRFENCSSLMKDLIDHAVTMAAKRPMKFA